MDPTSLFLLAHTHSGAHPNDRNKPTRQCVRCRTLLMAFGLNNAVDKHFVPKGTYRGG